MIITIAVDPAVIPDPHNICDEMEKSLKAMKDTLSGKSDWFVGIHGWSYTNFWEYSVCVWVIVYV